MKIQEREGFLQTNARQIYILNNVFMFILFNVN